MLTLWFAACRAERTSHTAVEVLRVAPAQLLADSLHITPRLDTTQHAPEQGMTALRIEVHVKNAGGTAKGVPAIGFRAIPESERDTAHWRYDIARRRVDSLRPGEGAIFGLTTSPDALVSGASDSRGGVLRVEAVFADSTRERVVPLGRVRIRQPQR